jgi:ectoine hydroxylase-related dioxygenase (phytanoyl-CoA dioxygenase family)
LQSPLADYAQAFRTDGVVRIPQALSARDVRLIEAAFEWRMDNLDPGITGQLYPESGATFVQSPCDSSAEPVFRKMLRDTPVADVAAALFGSGPVWYMEEQVFYKDGGSAPNGARRTPWHQDGSYYPYRGSKHAVFWVPLDPVPKDCALEVVRGSHRGVLYSTAKFGDPIDDTTPLYANTSFPHLPEIEAEREKWDIVSWAAEPGDLLIFHAGALHGGGATRQGGRRRSLTLRFAGDDVVRVGDTDGAAPEIESFLDRYWALPLGAPVSAAGAAQIRPWDAD